MPMNVGEAITPAMTHTSHVLFRPFALRKWLALGFVSMLATGGGGSSGGGGGNNWPSDHSGVNAGEIGRNVLNWITGHIALIALAGILLLALSLVLLWLGSVFKFVYLNQITRNPTAIREPFHQFRGLGTSFFLWELAFSLVVTLVAVALIGLPLAMAFLTKADIATKVIAVAWAVIVGLATMIFASATHIFARDFVLATMFVRGVKVLEAWSVVMPILRANVGQCVLYLLLLIVISFVTSIGTFIILACVMIAFLIPAGLLALIGWAIWAASGQHLSPVLIGYAATVGIPLLLAFSYALTCAIQPLYVFRRAYALVVLGQADPSLATVPIPPTSGPRLMPEHGV